MSNEHGTWTRAAVIRGDVTSTGLVLLLAGLAGTLVSAAGVIPGALGALCAVGAAAGVLLIYVGRRAWREMLREVAAHHAHFNPGDSPVPWLSDELWRERNRFDVALDAPMLLMAEVDPMVPAFGSDATGAFTEPVLRPVTPEERGLAAVDEVPPDAPVPDALDVDGTVAALGATPGRFITVAPRWPICCGRLATLEAVTSAGRHERALYLPPQAGQAAEEVAGRGSHSFQCRACGRRYATDPGW